MIAGSTTRAPMDIFVPGSTLRLHFTGFDYHFEFTDPDEQGYVGSWWTTGNPPSPILLTDTGESFPFYAGTLEILPLAESDERGSDRDFRLLRLRSVVIQIGVESFVAGTLSFHTETEGWFIWGDANNRVPFTWSATGE